MWDGPFSIKLRTVNWSAFITVLILLICSRLTDLVSTYLYDKELVSEQNFLVKELGLGWNALVIRDVLVVFVLSLAFLYYLAIRRDCYPKDSGYSFGRFARYLTSGEDVTFAQSLYKAPKLKNLFMTVSFMVSVGTILFGFTIGISNIVGGVYHTDIMGRNALFNVVFVAVVYALVALTILVCLSFVDYNRTSIMRQPPHSSGSRQHMETAGASRQNDQQTLSNLPGSTRRPHPTNARAIVVAVCLIAALLVIAGFGVNYANDLASSATPSRETIISAPSQGWILDTVNGEFLTCFAHLYSNTTRYSAAKPVFSKLTVYWSVKTSEHVDALLTLDVGGYAPKAEKNMIFPPLPNYSGVNIWQQDANGQEGMTEIEINPVFNESALSAIKSPTNVNINLKVTDTKDGRVISAQTKNVRFLPLNYYSWSALPPSIQQGYTNSPRSSVVVLSTPHADAVQKILVDASNKVADGILRGYQEKPGYNHSENINEQMKAIYDTIAERNVTYVNTSATFSGAGSRPIKTPSQVMNDSNGNSMELSLLFASCFEAIGLNVYLIFPSGHAFVGVALWGNGSDSRSIVALETTNVSSSSGPSNYDDARTTADDEYTNVQNSNVVYVPTMRSHGFTPVPYLDK